MIIFRAPKSIALSMFSLPPPPNGCICDPPQGQVALLVQTVLVVMMLLLELPR